MLKARQTAIYILSGSTPKGQPLMDRVKAR
jgi:hypothetical protein